MAIRQVLPEYLRKSFDTPPVLNSQDRARYGYVPSEIERIADEMRAPHNKLGFLTQFYYFQITRRFYPIHTFHRKDIQAVARKFKLPADLSEYSGAAVMRHRTIIIETLHYRRITSEVRSYLITLATNLAQKEIRPRLIFGELSNWLFENKIEGLSYYPLAEIVSNALIFHENKIETALNTLLTPEAKSALDTLVGIDCETSESAPLDTPVFRELTTVDQSRAPKGIRANCAKLATIQELLRVLPPLSDLTFSPETVKYYAETALSFDTHQLVRRREQSYLFTYCFLIHQQRIIQDSLIDTILYTCQGREKFWLKKRNESIVEGYEYRKKETERIKKRNQELADLKANVNNIIHDSALSNETKVHRMTALLAQDDLLESHALEEACTDSASSEPIEYSRYHFEEKDSRHLQDRVAPPLKLIAFDKESSEGAIYSAVDHFRRKSGSISSTAPMQFLKDEEIQALTDEKKKFSGSLYKVFLFKSSIKGIKSGRLNLIDSYRYQSLERYLIDNEWWKANKQEILEQAGMVHFADVTTVLDGLRSDLYNQRTVTEQNLASGKNSHARLDPKNKVILDVPPVIKERQNFLSDYFPGQGSVNLYQILTAIDAKARFTECFEHQYTKNVKKSPSQTALLAGIIGYGCNIGIPQMGQMLKNVAREDVEYASQWYFSPENIDQANRAVLSILNEIELPTIYKKHPDKTHTSSDGQKVTVAVESLHANFSHKYFGTQMGVSIYTFIDESHRLYHSTVMVPSDREAIYVADGLLDNELVKSTIHSTDTHGYSEVNFALAHLIDVSFAPRIKTVKNQQLYKFESAAEANREGWKLATAGNINTELIEKQWDAILRFVATLKLHEAKGAQLFKRLNSQSLQHPLYAALKQFGRIIKSIYLLKYIDDVELRQEIEKQLNKIESYHSFAHAISFARNQELHYATKKEQDVAEGCKRLIANSIICWNYLYISTAIARANSEAERMDILKAVKDGSMVSWLHVNFHGEYDFSKEKLKNCIQFDLDEIRGISLNF